MATSFLLTCQGTTLPHPGWRRHVMNEQHKQAERASNLSAALIPAVHTCLFSKCSETIVADCEGHGTGRLFVGLLQVDSQQEVAVPVLSPGVSAARDLDIRTWRIASRKLVFTACSRGHCSRIPATSCTRPPAFWRRTGTSPNFVEDSGAHGTSGVPESSTKAAWNPRASDVVQAQVTPSSWWLTSR
jgi:hypothetical protein